MDDMETTRHGIETGRPYVLLAGVGAIPRHCLELALGSHADVGSCPLSDTRAWATPQLAVIDLTASHDLQLAIETGSRLADAGTELVVLGYGRDESMEHAISQELNATFNPSIEGLLELLHPLRRPRAGDDLTDQPRPGSPIGRTAIPAAPPGRTRE